MRAGLLSREIRHVRGADAVAVSGRQHKGTRYCKLPCGLARSKNLCTYGTFMHENREISWFPIDDGTVGRVGKSKDASRR